jgi:hypothetical protein
VDQVSRVLPDDVSTQDPTPLSGHYLDEPLRLAVDDGPIHLFERLAVDPDLPIVLFAGLLLGESYPCYLWVAEGRPGDNSVIGLGLDRDRAFLRAMRPWYSATWMKGYLPVMSPAA